MEPIIYWCRSAGLANRIRSLIGYQSLSHYINKPFYLCWEPDHACDVDFSEIFTFNYISIITLKQKQEIEKRYNTQTFANNPTHIEIWEKYAQKISTLEQFHLTSLRYLNDLQPVPEISEKIMKFVNKYDLPNNPAIHIRFTDNIKGYKRWTQRQLEGFDPQNIPKLKGYEQFIKNMINNNHHVKIFLATDNQKVQKRIQKSYPNNTITYPKRYQPRYRINFSLTAFRSSTHFQRTSSIQEALIELFLLSKCKTLLGTYWSSYSHIAAFMGNAEYFEVRGDKYVPVSKEKIYTPSELSPKV